jgi:hypothetical protein
MAKVNSLLVCFYCQNDCSPDYITIEKNYEGDTVIFLDLCTECFKTAADDTLKACVFGPCDYKCIYCNNVVENETGEPIMSNYNATGKYCSVMYKIWQYTFMHVECYEKNIGI